MNVRRFAARTSREALSLVREALGEDAVVLSTKPTADGVEVLAMAPEGLQQAEAAAAPAVVRAPAPAGARPRTLSERIAARGEAKAGQTAPGASPTLAERGAALVAALASRGAAGASGTPKTPAATARAPTATAATARAPAGAGLAERLQERQVGRSSGRAPAPATSRAEPRMDPPLQGPSDDDIDPSVARDVETLGMSTLTFQDYVRERMLRRRQAEREQNAPRLPEALVPPEPHALDNSRQRDLAAADRHDRQAAPALRVVAGRRGEPAGGARHAELLARANAPLRRGTAPVLHDEIRYPSAYDDDAPSLADDDAFLPAPKASRAERERLDERTQVMGELREVRHLIEERFGMLAYMERMQRDPRQVGLLQKLFDTGLSPGMVRKLAQALPADATDEMAWAAGVLERNLLTADHEPPLEDHEGVLALIGPTGVGKTTTTAKIAAACVARHGAASLGLITLDAYRVAAHEQLRTYGRILGVPVHTAHDRSSLEDLMGLLAGKKLVLIDTAGVAQRDTRTRETLEMLSHRAIEKVLVVNAAAQGETVEDVMAAYGSANCRGVILSKLDEAVKLGPALDALIRQRAKVLGVTNGQRVPEDWHRLSANALVQRALRGGGSASWRLDANEVNLVFAATHGNGYPAGPAPAPAGGLHA